jgi:hypothetical protein
MTAGTSILRSIIQFGAARLRRQAAVTTIKILDNSVAHNSGFIH